MVGRVLSPLPTSRGEGMNGDHAPAACDAVESWLVCLPQVLDAHGFALGARYFARRLEHDVASDPDHRLDVVAYVGRDFRGERLVAWGGCELDLNRHCLHWSPAGELEVIVRPP